jgi:hypothetical protein
LRVLHGPSIVNTVGLPRKNNNEKTATSLHCILATSQLASLQRRNLLLLHG